MECLSGGGWGGGKKANTQIYFPYPHTLTDLSTYTVILQHNLLDH